jgi:hypothetical protein
MAFFKRSLPAGIVIGVVAGVAARDMFPRLGNIVKPMSKVTLKSGLLAYEKVKEAFAHVGESLEDLASEVRTEMATEQSERSAEPTKPEAVTMRKPSAVKEAKVARETDRHVS